MNVKCKTRGCKNIFSYYEKGAKIRNWGKEYCSKCVLERKRTREREAIRKKLADPIFRVNHLRAVIHRQRKPKVEILTHYGKNGKLRCCWPGCKVDDNDCLTLDHINNDGAKQRKEFSDSGRIGTGTSFNYFLKKNGFPEGYQTLCANHQLKKETLRKRKKSDEHYETIILLYSEGAKK